MAKKVLRHVRKAHTPHHVRTHKAGEQNMFVYIVMYGLAALLLLVTAIVVNSRREMSVRQTQGVLGVQTQEVTK